MTALWLTAGRHHHLVWRAVVAAVAFSAIVAISGCGVSTKVGTNTPSASTGGTPSGCPPGASTAPTATLPHELGKPSPTLPPGRSYVPDCELRTISELPKAAGPEHSTATVQIFASDPATEEALASAFDKYEGLVGQCKAATIVNTVRIGKVRASDVTYAIAGFQPGPSCSGNIRSPDEKPFDVVPPPPVGLFEQQLNSGWVMNTETGKPFPCPPLPGQRQPSDVVPPEVLAAWNIPYYSPTCITYFPALPP